MIFYITGTILLTLFGGLGLFFAKSPKARRWLKTKVKNRWRSQAVELGKARTARSGTPRAQRRKKRKTQPLGLLVRKRAPDDPRTVRKIMNRAKVATANRKAVHAGTQRAQPVTHRVANKITKAVRPVVIPAPTRTAERIESTMTTCQAFAKETKDGTCHNPALTDDAGNTTFACWIPSHRAQLRHNGRKAASS